MQRLSFNPRVRRKGNVIRRAVADRLYFAERTAFGNQFVPDKLPDEINVSRRTRANKHEGAALRTEWETPR